MNNYVSNNALTVIKLDDISDEPFFDSEIEEKESVKDWLDKIGRSENAYQSYYELIKKTRETYRASQSTDIYDRSSRGAYNIFWSGIETQKPFLYFKRPQLYIDRVNKIATPAEQLACKILERALEWDLTQFDFDSVVKYARNDYLISGCGILFETYCPSFKTIKLPETIPSEATEKTIDFIEKETVETRYVDPVCFLADTEHVGVWEDVRWIAKKMYLKEQELIDQFGDDAAEKCGINPVIAKKDKFICLYEIWDKSTRRVYWVSPDSPNSFIKITEDPFHLTNFFPCPKPIFGTLSNDSLIPVPDYSMIARMIDELNGITERMRLTMQAIKVSGVYDNAFHRLADIFEKDVTLISLADFDKLKASGGIKGVIDFIPIDQYITALEQLSRRRDDVMQRIYEITGVSDIMRGNSNVGETATAVVKKTNFGTLRNQERQNDMQRFIADLYRIKGEIICTCFSEPTLARFINMSEGYPQETINQAVSLLKADKMRGMLIHIESNGGLNADMEVQKTIKGVQSMTDLIKDAMPIVSMQPLLLPLYRQMISAVVAQIPHARVFESVLDQAFTSIQTELSKKDDSEVSAQVQQRQAELKAERERMERQTAEQLAFNRQLAVTKTQNDYEIEKEKNALKARELTLKETESQKKDALERREMDMQYALKMLAFTQSEKGKKSPQSVDINLIASNPNNVKNVPIPSSTEGQSTALGLVN